MKFNFGNVESIDILPSDMAQMEVFEAVNFLNGAASSISPDDVNEMQQFYGLRSALEDFLDDATGLAETERAIHRVEIDSLRRNAQRVVAALQEVGIAHLNETDNPIVQLCAFVIEGVFHMLSGRFEAQGQGAELKFLIASPSTPIKRDTDETPAP